MPKATVYNMAGQQVGEVELSEGVFGVEPNESAVHAVVVNHLANCRQGTQSALTRAEVSGGGKKPWRQKGTGRARQGSTRAPQWTHGGIVFAPKPRDYSYRLNRKLKRLALKSVLSDRPFSSPPRSTRMYTSPPGTSPASPLPPPPSSASMTSSTPRSWWWTRRPWPSSRRCSHENSLRHHQTSCDHRAVHGRIREQEVRVRGRPGRHQD